MKGQNLVINILVALVAVLAGHIFWPGVPVTNKSGESWQPGPALTAPVAPAVTATPPPTQPASLITPDIRAQLDKARQAALVADPKLKTEEDDLNKARMALMKQTPPASQADRMALMDKWKTHISKMREAMVKADPALGPVFAELDAKVKARQEQMQAQFHSAPGAVGPNAVSPVGAPGPRPGPPGAVH